MKPLKTFKVFGEPVEVLTAGSTGRMLVFVAPAGMEKYLEEISPLSIPEDMPQILAISERYGITFVS